VEQEVERPGRFGDCSREVIGACIEVHRTLGPGLLESAYEACLARELVLRELRFEQQKVVPIVYKGIRLECAYRIDFVVCDELVVELKAVQRLLPIHEAQVISYLRLTRPPAALIVNFHANSIRRGLRRLTLHPQEPSHPFPFL
jgi:GxxExxY protein